MANNTNTTGQINADTAIYNTVNVANGGTNLSATPTNGQLPIGNGSGYALATLTAGTGIAITNAAGAITIANTAGGVTSAVAGNGIAVSAATGAVTFSAAAPTFNTVGSYVLGYVQNASISAGSTYSAGNGASQVQSGYMGIFSCAVGFTSINNLSGTWRSMGGAAAPPNLSLFCRVA